MKGILVNAGIISFIIFLVFMAAVYLYRTQLNVSKFNTEREIYCDSFIQNSSKLTDRQFQIAVAVYEKTCL
jgi:hypothetical protein